MGANAFSEDARWDFRFGYPGANGAVLSATVHEGHLYVAGGFSAMGGSNTRFVAGWTGEEWRGWDTGLESISVPSSFGHAIASWGGQLFLGGRFYAMGPTNALFRWDEARWASFGGLTGAVYTVVASGHGLYVGGAFAFPDSSTNYGVARWDGLQWETFNSAITGTPDQTGNWGVYDVVVNGSEVILSGRFFSLAGQAISSGARWDGSQWVSFPTGGGAIALHDGAVHVSRYLYTTTGRYGPCVGRWDGTNWLVLGDTFSHPADDLLSDGTHLYACGEFTNSGVTALSRVAQWDGTDWRDMGLPDWGLFDADGPFRLAIDPDGAVLGLGIFSSLDGRAAGGVARWQNGQWHAVVQTNVLGTSEPGFVYALLAEDQAVLAGGRFQYAGLSNVNSVAALASRSWSGLGEGLPSSNSIIFCMTRHQGDLVAGGVSLDDTGGLATNLFRWNGGSWSAVAGGLNGKVYAVNSDGTNLFVGGNFTQPGGVPASYLARWDGVQWNAVGSGVDGPVRALGMQGSTLLAGGSFTNAGGVLVRGIAAWDGVGWQALGGGLSGPMCAAIHVRGNRVYVGGSFTNAGGIPADNIAMWNGAGWSALGDGVTGGTVYAIAARDHRVYVGGSFTQAGGRPALGLACWDGEEWSALGSGLGLPQSNPRVLALAVGEDSVYVGGLFYTAGSAAAGGIARWVDQPTLRLTDVNWLSDDETELTFRGVAGLKCELQGAASFGQWTGLVSATVTKDPLLVRQQGAPSTQMFRLRLLP